MGSITVSIQCRMACEVWASDRDTADPTPEEEAEASSSSRGGEWRSSTAFRSLCGREYATRAATTETNQKRDFDRSPKAAMVVVGSSEEEKEGDGEGVGWPMEEANRDKMVSCRRGVGGWADEEPEGRRWGPDRSLWSTFFFLCVWWWWWGVSMWCNASGVSVSLVSVTGEKGENGREEAAAESTTAGAVGNFGEKERSDESNVV